MRGTATRTTAKLIGVACALLLVAACGSGRSAESEALVPQGPGDLDGTSWLLVATGDYHAVPQSTPLTLRVTGKVASGTGPCNTYRLPFVVDGDDVTTGKVAATKKACPQPRLAAEHRFFRMLEAVDSAEKDTDQLVLSGPDDVRMTFDPADEPVDAIAGEWDVLNIGTANALVTPVKGTDPTLTFESDGTLTIETGCNTGSTTWTADGTSLSIDPPRMTKKACPEPQGLAAQEAGILDALAHTTSVVISDGAVNHDTAVLVNGEDGSTTLVLARNQ